MSLLISNNWKGENYDFVLVIVNCLTKIVFYKLIKITIDAPELAKVIINELVYHYGILESIITDRGSLFT